jgi:hypothetical protein
MDPNLNDLEIWAFNTGGRKARPYKTLTNPLGREGFIPDRT